MKFSIFTLALFIFTYAVSGQQGNDHPAAVDSSAVKNQMTEQNVLPEWSRSRGRYGDRWDRCDCGWRGRPHGPWGRFGRYDWDD
ncbi:hypothetical protein DFQ28_004236 [Apophysomyces sp. BC1034]|nr:hypothetical protein DFQ30_005369 [Apophysomyces sp. BC1015]KAG0178523.1 hypothetical protein DFQ29_003336 [Apophysomyces sp. BC1021]KAG0188863.1 hypothetical protein DFQ28_004236 [Apophysomyces sp. BC1034]